MFLKAPDKLSAVVLPLGMTLSYQGRHRRHSKVTRIILTALFAIAVTVWSLVGVQTAGASVSYDGAALNWAEANAARHLYAWGGTGPSYDCSGLIYKAFLHEGITLPRTTYGMLASGHLVRTYSPQRGDLAFWGSGHVEFVTIWYHMTFGAHDTGSLIGWIRYGGSWQPTAFYRVVR